MNENFGDLIDFVMRRNGVSFPEAVQHIDRVRRRAVPRDIETARCACGDFANMSAWDAGARRTRYFCVDCFSCIPNGNKEQRS